MIPCTIKLIVAKVEEIWTLYHWGTPKAQRLNKGDGLKCCDTPGSILGCTHMCSLWMPKVDPTSYNNLQHFHSCIRGLMIPLREKWYRLGLQLKSSYCSPSDTSLTVSARPPVRRTTGTAPYLMPTNWVRPAKWVFFNLYRTAGLSGLQLPWWHSSSNQNIWIRV